MTSSSLTTVNGPPLTSDDLEEVLLELSRFEKSPTTNIPSLLERFLVYVAKTGCAYFPWTKIKPLFRAKLENVILDFSNASPTDEIPSVPNVDVFNFAAIRNKVFEQLDAFAGIPFTVQRLAELLTSPRRHYKRTDKFMRALEKNMLIVSTVEARANNNLDSDNRNSYLMNGEYLSNGNGVGKDSNGNSPSPEAEPDKLDANPSELLQRDCVEDELDAEMAEVPAHNPANSADSQQSPEEESRTSPSKLEDDEMVTEDKEKEVEEEKTPDQSTNEAQAQRSEEEIETTSSSTANEASAEADSKEMEVESSSMADSSSQVTEIVAEAEASESSPTSTEATIPMSETNSNESDDISSTEPSDVKEDNVPGSSPAEAAEEDSSSNEATTSE